KEFSPLAHFAIPIYYHHTHWQDLKNTDITIHDANMANIIFISDRIDILSALHYESDILLARKEIVQSISQYSGTYFNPSFVNAFIDMEKSEAFWIALEDRHITRYTWDMGQIENNQPLSIAQIKQLSLIMSYIVDQKSPFTAQHSIRVADLSKYISTLCGLSREQCDKVEIAGLLHDIGKLHMPDRILEKKGPLDDVERSIMEQHSYETYEILRHIKGLGEVALWSAYHHEGINGVGYPFHPSEKQLNVEARIIAVADVFQALVQDRPYRPGMPLEKITSIMDEMVISGKLDKDIIELVKKHGNECFNIGSGNDPEHNLSYINLFPEQNNSN
ncbi:MAG: HD domain-containing protein, partial [Candidatus Competibacteraceae bacterium]|nr:HD domain-containing protein [Candidatus Competibacteraceae bacterium]